MSVNKVILMGNVGKDPDVKTFEKGGCVAQFPLATRKEVLKQETERTAHQHRRHQARRMICRSEMIFEIEIKIPVGSRLIGTRTKGKKVIAVCEFIPPKQPEPEPRRPIGFAVYDRPTGKKQKT